MELGLHISNFTWDGGTPELGATLGRLARSAEDAGVARLTVMDHVWQIGGIGPPEKSVDGNRNRRPVCPSEEDRRTELAQ